MVVEKNREPSSTISNGLRFSGLSSILVAVRALEQRCWYEIHKSPASLMVFRISNSHAHSFSDYLKPTEDSLK